MTAFTVAASSTVAERYRHPVTLRAGTLRYFRTPKGNHAVEGGPVGADRTFRSIVNARDYWRTLRALMTAAGYIRHAADPVTHPLLTPLLAADVRRVVLSTGECLDPAFVSRTTARLGLEPAALIAAAFAAI